MSEANDAPRILVINYGHIGDAVMSTAALRLLRKMRPQAHITLHVSAPSARLLRLPELADEVIEEKKTKKKWLRSLRRTWRALRYRLGRYDICFLFDVSRSDLWRIRRLSNIPVRVCASQNLHGERWPEAAHATHVIPVDSVWDTHVVDYFQDIIQGFFQGLPDKRVIFSRETPKIAEPARRAALPAKPGQKRVAFCFEGAPTNPARWPEEYFVDLLGRVREQGWYAYAAVPEGGTGYTERLAAQGGAVDVFESDLTDCCALLREADLLISTDTGQVHLAAALGRPVISLGGPTGSSRTRPYSPSGVMLTVTPGCFSCSGADDCPPKAAGGRQKKRTGFIPQCMLALTPEMVFARALEILS